MALEAIDILARAAPINCVGHVSDPDARDLLEYLSPWMPSLRTCAGIEALSKITFDHRPDIVIVGRSFDITALETLQENVRTSKLGLAILRPRDRAFECFMIQAAGRSPQIDVEPIDPGAEPTEVVLRLRALLRRCRPVALFQRRTVGELTLDEGALTISIGEASAPLPLEGFRLIGPIFDLPDHVWTREELLSVAYGSMTRNSLRTVDVKLNATRRKLLAVLGRDPIRTVRGVGYKLAPNP